MSLVRYHSSISHQESQSSNELVPSSAYQSDEYRNLFDRIRESNRSEGYTINLDTILLPLIFGIVKMFVRYAKAQQTVQVSMTADHIAITGRHGQFESMMFFFQTAYNMIASRTRLQVDTEGTSTMVRVQSLHSRPMIREQVDVSVFQLPSSNSMQLTNYGQQATRVVELRSRSEFVLPFLDLMGELDKRDDEKLIERMKKFIKKYLDEEERLFDLEESLRANTRDELDRLRKRNRQIDKWMEDETYWCGLLIIRYIGKIGTELIRECPNYEKVYYRMLKEFE